MNRSSFKKAESLTSFYRYHCYWQVNNGRCRIENLLPGYWSHSMHGWFIEQKVFEIQTKRSIEYCSVFSIAENGGSAAKVWPKLKEIGNSLTVGTKNTLLLNSSIGYVHRAKRVAEKEMGRLSNISIHLVSLFPEKVK